MPVIVSSIATKRSGNLGLYKLPIPCLISMQGLLHTVADLYCGAEPMMRLASLL